MARKHIWRRWALPLLGAVAALIACAAESAQVHVETAPDFAPARGSKVSVLGVFHDGAMSEQAWALLASKLPGAFGGCLPGYGPSLREQQPELAKWVEDSTRQNGVSDELLERVAARAQGDLVMMLMVYRHIPESRHDAGARVSAPPPGRRGRFGARVVTPREEESESRVFELSASLYSVRSRHLVAEIDLRYAGDDLDEAMGAFSEKMRAVLPDGVCGGWRWTDPDPEDAAIRAVPPSADPDDGGA